MIQNFVYHHVILFHAWVYCEKETSSILIVYFKRIKKIISLKNEILKIKEEEKITQIKVF